MFYIEIIGIILALIIFNIWGNSYEAWHGNRDNKEFRWQDKLKRPLWGVILLFFIALIPVFNILCLILILGFFIHWFADRSLFFHSNSKIFKWLNKEI